MKCRRMTTRMQPTPTRNVPPQCKLARLLVLWKRRTILAAAAAPTSRSFVCDHFANAHSVVVYEKGQTGSNSAFIYYFAVIIISMNIATRVIAELSMFVRTLSNHAIVMLPGNVYLTKTEKRRMMWCRFFTL